MKQLSHTYKYSQTCNEQMRQRIQECLSKIRGRQPLENLKGHGLLSKFY